MLIILSFKGAICCLDKTGDFNFLTFSLQTFFAFACRFWVGDGYIEDSPDVPISCELDDAKVMYLIKCKAKGD